MKRNILKVTLLLASFCSSPAWAVKVGDVLPKISVAGPDGQLAEPWLGKPTLINFWATWCDACKVELKEMASELKTLGSSHQVVFVSLDKETEKARKYFDTEFKGSKDMSQSLFHDAAFKLADSLGVESFPMTLVVDADGKVLKIQDGFKPGSGSTTALFETLKKTGK